MFCLFFFDGVVDISQTTLATVLAIEMCSHEDTGSAFLTRAFTSQTMDFSIVVYSVVFQDGQLDLLVLVFDLFGSGVILLLAFLSTTTETKHQVQGGFYYEEQAKRSKLKSRQQQSQQGYYPNKDENWISVSSSTNCCFVKKLEKKGKTYLFGCCSQKVFGHLPTAFRQRSNVADLEEFPPYLGS